MTLLYPLGRWWWWLRWSGWYNLRWQRRHRWNHGLALKEKLHFLKRQWYWLWGWWWHARWRRCYLFKLLLNHDHGADYDADDDVPDEEDAICSPMTEWWSGWAPSFSSLSTKSQADTPGSSSRLRRCFAWVLVIYTVKVSTQWYVWATEQVLCLSSGQFSESFPAIIRLSKKRKSSSS